MTYRYIVEQHSNSRNHKTWRVVRRYDNRIMCVCVYMRGAYRVCDELNALASGIGTFRIIERREKRNG